jgi:integrase
VWDLRALPGVAVTAAAVRRGDHRVSFRAVPAPFRAAVKAYAQRQVAARRAGTTIQDTVRAVAGFLRWYAARFPAARDLADLSPQVVDAHLRDALRRRSRRPGAPPPRHVQVDLGKAIAFLEYLHAEGSPLVPATLAPHLLRGRVSIVGGRVLLRGRPALAVVEPGAAGAAGAAGEAAGAPAEAADREFAKDVWDLRRIPGVRMAPHWSVRTLRFDAVPPPFRPAVKGYARFLLTAADRSVTHASVEVRRLRDFLQAFAGWHPEARDLSALDQADVERWLRHLRATPGRRGGRRSDRDVLDAILAPQRLARYLQRVGSPLAPAQPTERIFIPEHLPLAPKRVQGQVKYLPEGVLRQLDAHLHRLPEAYLPVVILLRASGWRISDVLGLRSDVCLEQDGGNYALVGDIHKTRVLGHKVPITADVAAVVRVQAARVRALPERDNPQRYLFPSTYHARWGRPVAAGTIRDALRALVDACGITGPDGRPFYVKAHAFRHTMAVELINNGMSPAMVQHWLAHLTPEMTMVYARIQEQTLRREWQQAVAGGVLRLTDAGPQLVDAEQVIGANELELGYIRSHLDATRTDKGYCFKPRKLACPFVELPCYACRNFATTPAFLPEFERMAQDLLVQVDLGQRAGRPHWVDKNERKLAQIRPIVETLRAGRIHAQMPKGEREYTPVERQAGAVPLEEDPGGAGGRPEGAATP